MYQTLLDIVREVHAASRQRQLDDGLSSNDEAAEAEAFSAIPAHLISPLGTTRGMMGFLGFNAVIKVGELRAAYCVRQHELGDTDMLRQAFLWIEEAEHMQQQVGVPFGCYYGQYVADLQRATDTMSQTMR